MMKTYETCFFDLDGTIVDSSLGITNAVIHSLKKFGIEPPDRKELYSFIGPPLRDSYAKYYGFDEEKCRKAILYYREYYQDQGIYENQVYEGLESTLKALKERGKKLVVATSKPEVFAKRILEYYHLADYFDYVAGMEIGGGRATKVEVIEYALWACKIENRSAVIMVGDRMHDVTGAKLAGIDCIGVLYGFGSREELEHAGASYIVETPQDILKIV